MATTDPIPASIAATAGPAAHVAAASPADKIEAAARLYLRRRCRLDHPAGAFDDGGRWYPGEADDFGAEEQPCCLSIRRPSRAHPYSILVHCRTLDHVCWLFGLHGAKKLAVRRRARELELTGEYR